MDRPPGGRVAPGLARRILDKVEARPRETGEKDERFVDGRCRRNGSQCVGLGSSVTGGSPELLSHRSTISSITICGLSSSTMSRGILHQT